MRFAVFGSLLRVDAALLALFSMCAASNVGKNYRR
jgi:hypothetical protein